MDEISEAADPATPLARLADLAHRHPETRVAVAGNPSTYPGLLTWLGGLHDPEIDAALRRRELGEPAAPAAAPPPPPEAAPEPDPDRKPAPAPAAATEIPAASPSDRFRLLPAVAAQFRTLLRGRQLVVLVIVIAAILGAEAAAVGVAAVVQQPTASAHGYDYGPNVGAEVLRVPAPDVDYLSDLTMSPTGELQASTDTEVITFDPETLKEVRRDPLRSAPPGWEEVDPTVFSYSPDGNVLYTVADTYDTRVLAVDRDSGRILNSVEVGGFFIASIAVAPQSGMIFASTLEEGAESPGDLIAIDPVTFREVARTDIGDFQYIEGSVSADGAHVCLTGPEIVSYADGAFSAPVPLAGSHSCAGFSPDNGAVLRYGSSKISVADVITGKTLFKFETTSYLSHPVALTDPSLGFANIDELASDDYRQYLFRYTADAPRLTTPALLGILAVVDLVLVAIGLLIVFLIPVTRRRRATAPQRAAAAAARIDQRRQWEAAQQRVVDDQAHAQRVNELAKWEAAYASLHPGEPIPPMPVSAAGGTPAGERTNTLAILALVFGLGGGLLGIIFGHAARSQIRRTGERGWGLATAGLVFGYLGLISYAVVIIVFAVIASRS